MQLIVLAAAVLVLLLLIARLKLNAFISLLITSMLVALVNGMAPERALASVVKGVGDTMGSLVLILVFGAVLGELIAESGAAHTISYALIDLFGEQRLQYAVLVTGFLVGLPMIYNAGFLVLIPLVYTLATTSGRSMMYVGIPLTSALAVTHGYLPPHPAPASVAVLFHADMNLTLLYGLILSIPAMLLAGPFLARFARGMSNKPPASLFVERKFDREALPGLGLSLFTTLIPVMLMLGGAVVSLSTPENSALRPAAKFLSDPNIALFLAAMIALYTLGLRRGRTMEALMGSVGKAAASVSMVILIIAAGGAFKQVLIDCGTAEMIKGLATQAKISPIVLAWGMAALLRAALGSATVAAITASGMLLPVVAASGVRPELLVIATTSGSLMFSHFNDIGFWMFKEYYNCTVKQTFQIWSVMEGIVAVIGLLGALAFNAI